MDRRRTCFISLGWFSRALADGKHSYWHTGSLPGTAAILIRRHDGKNFTVLFNARSSPHASHFGRAIDGLLHEAAGEVDQWPTDDLFPEFEGR